MSIRRPRFGVPAGLVDLARDADVLLAEASFVDEVAADNLGTLSSARDAGRQAAEAGVRGLVLTHLLPGTDRAAAYHAAEASFSGPIRVARLGLALTVGEAFPVEEAGDGA